MYTGSCVILFPSVSAMSLFLSVLLREKYRSTVLSQTQLLLDHFSLDPHVCDLTQMYFIFLWHTYGTSQNFGHTSSFLGFSVFWILKMCCFCSACNLFARLSIALQIRYHGNVFSYRDILVISHTPDGQWQRGIHHYISLQISKGYVTQIFISSTNLHSGLGIFFVFVSEAVLAVLFWLVNLVVHLAITRTSTGNLLILSAFVL